MNIFIIGLPKSGRTTVAKALTKRFELYGWTHVDATSWVRSTFRTPKEGEQISQYEDEYQAFLSKRLLSKPSLITDHINEMVNVSSPSVFVIDGINSPRDFINYFDYRKDIVIFLNRNDNEYEYRDHENIAVSVMRDYCFWMASAGLIAKERWLEFNFKMLGDDSDFIKVMGVQNTVILVRSLNKVVQHLIERLTTPK